MELLQDPEGFSELMSLVRMDKKPLHVRRFRKALEECVKNLTGITNSAPVPVPLSSVLAMRVLDPQRSQPPEALCLNFSGKTSHNMMQSKPFSAREEVSVSPTPTISNQTLPTNPINVWPGLPPALLQHMQANPLLQLLSSSCQAQTTTSHTYSNDLHNTENGPPPSQRPSTSTMEPNSLLLSSLQPTVASSSPLNLPTTLHTEEEMRQSPLNESSGSWNTTPTQLSEEGGMPRCMESESPRNVRFKVDPDAQTTTTKTTSPSSSLELQLLHKQNHEESMREQFTLSRPSAFLLNTDVNKLESAFNAVQPFLPKFSIRQLNLRNTSEKELQELLKLSIDDPKRLDGLRRHSAIFGRFDSPKRLARPLRHFEICINELTHLLIRNCPELSTQREHLFHMARQIVNITNYGMSVTETGNIIWRMLDSELLCKSTGKRCLPSFEETMDENMEAEDEKSRFQRILLNLKDAMQKTVDEENELRNQLRNFTKDTAVIGQMKKKLDRLVNQLHELFNLTTKFVVMSNSL